MGDDGCNGHQARVRVRRQGVVPHVGAERCVNSNELGTQVIVATTGSIDSSSG